MKTEKLYPPVFLCLLLLLGFVPSIGYVGALSDSDTETATKDSYVSSVLPTTNYGTATSLKVQSLTGYLKRGLLEFNVAAYQAVNIQDVTLRLYCSAAAASGRTYNVSRITGSWTETGVNWNNQPATTSNVSKAAPTGTGWWEANVTDIYVAGTSIGFRVADASEGSGSSGTFGYTSIGATKTQEVGDTIRGSLFTTPAGGVYVTKISVAVQGASAHNTNGKAAIYLHSTLALVASTPEVSINFPATAAWRDLPFTDPVSLAASTEYVLVLWCDQGAYQEFLAHDAGDTDQGHGQGLGYTGTFPDPMVAAHDNYKYSIYATYYTTTDQSTFDSREGTHPPELVISYTYEETYTIKQGRYENNTLVTSMEATAHYSAAESSTFTITGDMTMRFAGDVLFFAWLVSGNTYRIYYPAENGETITFFEPDADWAVYEFTLQDYAGATQENSYITSYHIIGGQLQPIERRNAHEVINTIPLVLVVGGSYKIVLTCGSMEYIFGWFLASSDLTAELTLKTIDFPTNLKLAYKYILADAARSENNTVITVNYQDTLEQTQNVTLYMLYPNGTVAYGPDTSEQSTVQWNWNQADNMTDYTALLNINHEELGALSWKKTVPYIIGVSSPFDLSPLGTFPGSLSTQLVSVIIILCTASVFSVLTVPLGLAAMIWTAALLRYLGWITFTGSLTGDVELLAIVGSLMFLYGLYDASRRERY